MDVPLQVSFPDTQKPQDADQLIRKHVDKLEEVCDHITSCRLTVELPNKHKESGHPFRIRVDVHVPPKHEIVATNHPNVEEMHDSFEMALKKTFDKARRQLRDLSKKQNREVKQHPAQEKQGIVSQLNRDENHGFIREADTNHPLYFHENSVLHGDWEELMEGSIVRYVSSVDPESDGARATTVELVSNQ